MKKLIKKIIKWAHTDPRDNSESDYPIGSNSVGYKRSISASSSLDAVEQPFTFTLYNASGGKVIQCSHYDRVKDRHVSNLYIINQDDNFGDEISMIITKESLTR